LGLDPEGVVEEEQRDFATASIEELRSNAFMAVIGIGGEADMSLMVLRPVPQPSSVMVIGVGEVEMKRGVNAWERRVGRR